MKTTYTFQMVALSLLLLPVPGCGGDEKPATGPAATGPAATGPAATGPAAGKPAGETAKTPAPAKPAHKVPRLPPKLEMALVTAYFGSEPAAPAFDNPSTPDKVALGKQLFAETVVSKGGNQSCASCHDLSKYGQDGLATATSPDGTKGKRNTLTVLDAYRQLAEFWDGRAATVEDAVLPGKDPVGHGAIDPASLVGKLRSKPELVAAFGKAFPGQGDPVTADNFKLAVGAFLRTLTTRSAFDDFLDGNNNALTTDQKYGLKAFIEVGCIQCHTTRLVGGNLLQKFGLLRPHPTNDQGRFAITGNEQDRFFFKVPSLRNVEKTAPYLHDGEMATLEDTVRLMGQIQLNKELSDDDVESITAFLKSLTGQVPADAVR
jgi:cytochrome c peroxidase